ncbi:MAG TPA: hypothetical protein PKY46_07900 [Ignavibacteriaceae bacterium]|nr:hypothetical protein [Ignavibacteriaceae bacterium]
MKKVKVEVEVIRLRRRLSAPAEVKILLEYFLGESLLPVYFTTMTNSNNYNY